MNYQNLEVILEKVPCNNTVRPSSRVSVLRNLIFSKNWPGVVCPLRDFRSPSVGIYGRWSRPAESAIYKTAAAAAPPARPTHPFEFQICSCCRRVASVTHVLRVTVLCSSRDPQVAELPLVRVRVYFSLREMEYLRDESRGRC